MSRPPFPLNSPHKGYGPDGLSLDFHGQFCAYPKKRGTVVEVEPFWMYHEELDHRTIHLSLHGGMASSETGYRSHFFNVKASAEVSLEDLLAAALDYAEERYNELASKGHFDGTQLDLFDTP